MMIILAAGLGIAGCSASKEGTSTMLPDSTRQDTMRTPPM